MDVINEGKVVDDGRNRRLGRSGKKVEEEDSLSLRVRDPLGLEIGYG